MTEAVASRDSSLEPARLLARIAELEAELAVLRSSEDQLRAMFRAMTDVAVALLELGRDLSGVITRATLQDGIRHAQAHA